MVAWPANGGVHRGKDRFLRKHMARAQYIGALSGISGFGPEPKMVPIELGRMLRSTVAAYQIIVERAARGIGLGKV